jgi:hypothetical protein
VSGASLDDALVKSVEADAEDEPSRIIITLRKKRCMLENMMIV